MLKKNDYSKFIEHLRSGVMDLPDSEYLTPLLEASLTPEEAGFLSDLPFQLHTSAQLAEKFKIPENELCSKLDSLAKRGIIFSLQLGNTVNYALGTHFFWFYRSPYWSGKRDKKTKKIAHFALRYFHSGMGKEFGGYPPMFLRTIPIEQTIEDTRQFRPYEDVMEIVQREDYICVGHCACRQMKNLDPDSISCKHETLNCLHFGGLARYMVKQGMGKEISREEATVILLKAADEGLVHAVENAETGIESICNCCSCCCVFMQSAHILGLRGHEHSNYIIDVHGGTCKGCGLCVKRCPMDALRLETSPEANNKVGKCAVADFQRCIGCGVCVHKCPTHSLQLARRKEEQDIPKNFMALRVQQAKARGKNM